MKENTLFRPYRRYLLGQSLLRSFLIGAGVGAAATFLYSLVWHILIKSPPLALTLAVALVAFAAGFIPSLISTYPTSKRIAKRLDETGLMERAGTMLAFRDDPGLMAQLQRKDAVKHIRKTPVRRLKGSFPKRLAVLCSLCLVLCTGMLLLPQDFFLFVSAVDAEEYQRQQELRKKIDQLRQQIRQADLNEQLRAQMEEILDQLEKDMLNAQDEMEQEALLQQAQSQIEEISISSISRFIIGRALQEYTMTRPLGLQLEGHDPHFIEGHMDQLETLVIGSSRQLVRLCGNITGALETTGFNDADDLYRAFTTFVRSLESLDTSVYIGEEGGQEDSAPRETDIVTIFDLAEAQILDALDYQLHDEAELQEIFRTMSTITNSPATEKIVGMENETDRGDLGGGNNSSGTTAGTTAGGIVTSYGPSNSGPSTMLELLYDPVSGSITYGEVFAVYYSQYLDALDNGDISDDLRTYIEKYFSALS